MWFWGWLKHIIGQITVGIMDNMEGMNSKELDELRETYILTKECFDKEQITDAEAIERSLQMGLEELKTERRRWNLMSVGGMSAFAIAMFFVYGLTRSSLVLASTGVIILLYAGSVFLCSTARLDGLYHKDNTAFVKGVMRQQKRQYWFMRAYMVVFLLWSGFVITLPFVKLEAGGPRAAFLVAFLPFLCINLFTTVHMHNKVIGAYEGLLFDNEGMRVQLSESYYSTEAIKERKRKTARRKYLLCIAMIIVMVAMFVWQVV